MITLKGLNVCVSEGLVGVTSINSNTKRCKYEDVCF